MERAREDDRRPRDGSRAEDSSPGIHANAPPKPDRRAAACAGAAAAQAAARPRKSVDAPRLRRGCGTGGGPAAKSFDAPRLRRGCGTGGLRPRAASRSRAAAVELL
ncbi:MAG TPA: hypothetical protein VMS76_18785, partial [Planctomycetota bacterium]|nr:hypothetical protein [Planctomycetota bacterium]